MLNHTQNSTHRQSLEAFQQSLLPAPDEWERRMKHARKINRLIGRLNKMGKTLDDWRIHQISRMERAKIWGMPCK